MCKRGIGSVVEQPSIMTNLLTHEFIGGLSLSVDEINLEHTCLVACRTHHRGGPSGWQQHSVAVSFRRWPPAPWMGRGLPLPRPPGTPGTFLRGKGHIITAVCLASAQRQRVHHPGCKDNSMQLLSRIPFSHSLILIARAVLLPTMSSCRS